MSTYEDQSDSENAICPYCKHSYQVEGEDYNEDVREVECDECGKKYWLSQSFSVTHETRPDCIINGEIHAYKLKEFIAGTSAYFCEKCGKCSLDGK